MQGQESTGSVHDWVMRETEHIDVVASWESLCDTYNALQFSDRLSDAERLDEYKWIVQQMNSFLTKIRTKLLTCKDARAMRDLLRATYVPAGKVDLSARRALVYQKLRQRWITSSLMAMEYMLETEEGKESADGWTEPGEGGYSDGTGYF